MAILKEIRRSKLWYILVTRVFSHLPLSKNIYQYFHFRGPFLVKVKGIQFKLMHFGSNFENDIFWKGVKNCWEAKSIILWKSISKNCDTVFDIGANTGFYTLLSKAANPNTTVYSFEPLDRIFEMLSQNVFINNYSDVFLFQLALSDKTGKALIYDIPEQPHLRQASLHQRFNSEANRVAIEIEVTTASKLIIDKEIKRIDLIKLDVEEHELNVLLGFENYIEIFKPAIMIEIQNSTYGKEIEAHLRSKGYKYYINVSEQEGFYEVQNMENQRGRNYFCFISKEHFLNMCTDPISFN